MHRIIDDEYVSAYIDVIIKNLAIPDYYKNEQNFYNQFHDLNTELLNYIIKNGVRAGQSVAFIIYSNVFFKDFYTYSFNADHSEQKFFKYFCDAHDNGTFKLSADTLNFIIPSGEHAGKSVAYNLARYDHNGKKLDFYYGLEFLIRNDYELADQISEQTLNHVVTQCYGGLANVSVAYMLVLHSNFDFSRYRELSADVMNAYVHIKSDYYKFQYEREREVLNYTYPSYMLSALLRRSYNGDDNLQFLEHNNYALASKVLPDTLRGMCDELIFLRDYNMLTEVLLYGAEVLEYLYRTYLLQDSLSYLDVMIFANEDSFDDDFYHALKNSLFAKLIFNDSQILSVPPYKMQELIENSESPAYMYAILRSRLKHDDNEIATAGFQCALNKFLNHHFAINHTPSSTLVQAVQNFPPHNIEEMIIMKDQLSFYAAVYITARLVDKTNAENIDLLNQVVIALYRRMLSEKNNVSLRLSQVFIKRFVEPLARYQKTGFTLEDMLKNIVIKEDDTPSLKRTKPSTF